MLDDEDDGIPWKGYNEYTSELMDDDELLEYFGIQGPGPPSNDQSWRSNDQQWRSFRLPPPPALPMPSSGGDLNQCLVFSSPLDTCSSFAKVGDVSNEDSAYSGMNILSVIVAVCCVLILVSCITIFLLWKRRQKKSRLSHLQYRLSDSANFDYFPSRRMNKYYSDHSIRNQMEDSGVFYTSTMHPLYEEIPTPMSQGAESHYAVSGEYQLLNSDYSTLPYSDATMPYSESIPFLQNNLISVMPAQQRHTNIIGGTPATNSRTSGKGTNKFSSQKTLPPIIKSGPFFSSGGAKTCDIMPDSYIEPGGILPPGYHDGQWRTGGRGWISTNSGGGRMQTLDPGRHISSTAAKRAAVAGHSEASPRYHQLPHSKPTTNATSTGNQNDFLPREAWTDFSGADDWQHRQGDGAATVGGKSRHQPNQFSKNTLDCPGVMRASLRNNRDCWADSRSSGGGSGGGDSAASRDTTGSAESREISPTLNSLESSDVTISTNSSDTYPPVCLNPDMSGEPL